MTDAWAAKHQNMMRTLLACLLPFTLTACITTSSIPDAPDNFRDPAFQPPPAGARITLLPMQETQYEILRDGAEMLEDSLMAQLKAMGYKVALIKRDDYLRLWQEEAKAVGGVYEENGTFKPREYMKALDSLVRKSCDATQCALLINHQLVTRPALIDDGYIAWDSARLPLLNPDVKKLDQGHGISVELTAITPAGALAFKHYGAVTPLTGLTLTEMQQYVKKQQFFVEGDINQGARLALKPMREKVAPSPAVQKSN